MNSDLTPELIDQIIFSMENQNEYFYLNIEKGAIEPERLVDPELRGMEDRYVKIPRWGSADGFHLMEKFVDSLRNPVFRERLREALASGKGVFRKFKNILKEREDIQRLWFLFKEREMRARVVEWFNEIMDAWGYERIGPEPEETEELVLTDFVIETAPDDLLEELDALDHTAFEEAWRDQPDELAHLHFLARRTLIPQRKELYRAYRAAAHGGETAGVVWGVDSWLGERAAAVFGEEPAVSFLLQIYIYPEFRGLGIARLLLDTYIRQAYGREMRMVALDLWGGTQSVGRVLEERGFKSLRTSWFLDLDQWGRDQFVQ